MDIKQKILKKMIDTDEDFVYIVSHHPIVYVPLMIISAIGIIILFFLYKFLAVYFPVFASYFVGILGLWLYFYFLLNFFDIYLDAIAVTPSTLIIYKWYGIFKNTTDVLDLQAVESVFADQSWLIDILFNNWDIYIRRAGHTNVFDNVFNPNKVANDINNLIFRLKRNEESEEVKENFEPDLDEEKIKMLAQAMIEVMKEMK